MKFVIEGIPIAQKRHRDARRGNFTIRYDPCAKDKEEIGATIAFQMSKAWDSKNKHIVTELSELACNRAFVVKMTFYLAIPQSLNRRQKNRLLWGLDHCNKKPDLDNVEKFYLDCLTKVFWEDDCQVTKLASDKFYSLKPRTEIVIMAKKKPELHEEAEKILEVFGPTELFNFLQDTYKLFELYNVGPDDDWVEAAVKEGDAQGVRLARTAILLSVIADEHAIALGVIARKYPQFWKKSVQLAKELPNAESV